MENIIRKRRLKWLGHIFRMDKDRGINHVLHLVPEGRKRRGRTGQKPLRCLDVSCEEKEELAIDKDEWRRCLVRCADCRPAQDGLNTKYM